MTTEEMAKAIIMYLTGRPDEPTRRKEYRMIDILQRAKEAVEYSAKATPGPWEVEQPFDSDVYRPGVAISPGPNEVEVGIAFIDNAKSIGFVIRLMLLIISAALLEGMRPQCPGTFGTCHHCRVEIDYAITYRFTNPCGLGDIEIIYPKWNGD